MGGFFKGRRRKLGIVTLAIALLLMGAYLRSQKYIEAATIRLNENRILAGCSNRGSFRLITLRYIAQTPSHTDFPIGTVKRERATVISNARKFAYDPAEIFFPVFFGCEMEWHANRQLLGFAFAEVTVEELAEGTAWKIPYLPIILFMTFVSSYFLLLNSRTRKPERENDDCSSVEDCMQSAT